MYIHLKKSKKRLTKKKKNLLTNSKRRTVFGMLRSCVCMRTASKKRHSTTSTDDTTPSLTSENETTSDVNATSSRNMTNHRTFGASSFLQILQTKGWYRYWSKAGRDLNMAKAERTIRAAVLIQRWYRRYRARMEIRRRYTWSIFTSLEYASENDQVELYNFFNALLTHIPEEAANKTGNRSGSTTDISEQKLSQIDLLEDEQRVTDKDYTGPHFQFPLGKKDVDVIIDFYRKKKNNNLHAKYVALILHEASKRLKKLPNLNVASTSISKQLTVLGDLHGKLDDLLVVFHKNGLPSTSNPYIFNGDFVDRGKKGIEVFILLLTCFLAFPGAVFLNRGNHEDSVMNGRYGFIREVQQKYKKHSEILLSMIDEVYRWLPLGSLINNKVLVVHGGISDSTDLKIVQNMDRGKYVSILRPSVEAGSESIDKTEWKQLFDIMWSDPQHNNGCEPNTLRGAGTYFGPDVTDTFLEKHNLKFIIRSHECKPDGYEFAHNDKVLTIFSASNYYAIGSNKGAYLKLNPSLEPYFVQYISAASKTKDLTIREKIGLIESSALRELGVRLRDNRDQLEAEFEKYDRKHNGIISVSHWCDSIENVTNLGLPWRLMRNKLAPMPPNSPPNEINYHTTLELLDHDVLIQAQEERTSVTDSLYRNRASLEAIFHILDKDHSGFISLDEFGEAVDILQKHLPGANSREELLNICKMMDINKDGLVDLNEFLEAFRLCDQARKQAANRNPHGRESSVSVTRIAATLAKPPDEQGDIDPDDHVSKSLAPAKQKK